MIPLGRASCVQNQQTAEAQRTQRSRAVSGKQFGRTSSASSVPPWFKTFPVVCFLRWQDRAIPHHADQTRVSQASQGRLATVRAGDCCGELGEPEEADGE